MNAIPDGVLELTISDDCLSPSDINLPAHNDQRPIIVIDDDEIEADMPASAAVAVLDQNESANTVVSEPEPVDVANGFANFRITVNNDPTGNANIADDRRIVVLEDITLGPISISQPIDENGDNSDSSDSSNSSNLNDYLELDDLAVEQKDRERALRLKSSHVGPRPNSVPSDMSQPGCSFWSDNNISKNAKLMKDLPPRVADQIKLRRALKRYRKCKSRRMVSQIKKSCFFIAKRLGLTDFELPHRPPRYGK